MGVTRVNDPPSPQSQIVTVSGTNRTARVGAYTDASLTKRQVVETPAASDLPPASGARTTGGIRPVYANDQATEIDNDDAATENADVEALPHAPNKWALGEVNGETVRRDPYANSGMVGQAFFDNQG
jgi:hypothetical protein